MSNVTSNLEGLIKKALRFKKTTKFKTGSLFARKLLDAKIETAQIVLDIKADEGTIETAYKDLLRYVPDSEE